MSKLTQVITTIVREWGIEVSSREQLSEAISEMLTHDGPAILEARVKSLRSNSKLSIINSKL